MKYLFPPSGSGGSMHPRLHGILAVSRGHSRSSALLFGSLAIRPDITYGAASSAASLAV